MSEDQAEMMSCNKTMKPSEIQRAILTWDEQQKVSHENDGRES